LEAGRHGYRLHTRSSCLGRPLCLVTDLLLLRAAGIPLRWSDFLSFSVCFESLFPLLCANCLLLHRFHHAMDDCGDLVDSSGHVVFRSGLHPAS
ncbi:unnamed protein product, partial [Larinioides sclopetarius]